MTARARQAQEELAGQGLFVDRGLLAQMVTICVERVLEEQMTRHLGAERYERTEARCDYRNGTKSRTMKTAVGELHFAVPQTRGGTFHPTVFERYQRSDKALVGALQEMVVAGVSTRRVAGVLEAMAGFELSSATVSRAMSELDEEIERFRSRRLDAHQYLYLIIDARYEKVRVNHRIVSQAVLVAAGITDEGTREILGFYVGDSESESTWGEVFADLKRRGLKGLALVVSDAHKGIRAALARHFQGVPWQRCRVHLMRELVKRVHWRDAKELIKDLQSIFASDDVARCREVAEEIATKWEAKAPKMAQALRDGVEDALTVQSLSARLRRKLHSTNMLERLMRELKRRTRVVGIFPNRRACERLFGALLIEIHEQWATEETRYLVLEEA